MKDLYKLLGIPPSSSENAIRRALEESTLSPTEREDIRFVLLDPTRRIAYDKYRSEIEQLLKVRSKANIQHTDNLLASGIHSSFTSSHKPPQPSRSDHTDTSSSAMGCLAIGSLATVLFLIILTIVSSNEPASNRNSYRPPQQHSSTPPIAPEIPKHKPPDKYLQFSTARHATQDVDKSVVIQAANRMRLHDSETLPVTGVLTRTDDWKSYAFGERTTGYAPLEVKTPNSGHYYLKVVHWGTNRVLLTAFIRGGETFETLIPVGSYEIRYASGQYWYGELLDFGPDASYARCDDRFDFTQSYLGSSGYTIELIKQVGGNLQTEALSEDEF